jgi:hypothetical protein
MIYLNGAVCHKTMASAESTVAVAMGNGLFSSSKATISSQEVHKSCQYNEQVRFNAEKSAANLA